MKVSCKLPCLIFMFSFYHLSTILESGWPLNLLLWDCGRRNLFLFKKKKKRQSRLFRLLCFPCDLDGELTQSTVPPPAVQGRKTRTARSLPNTPGINAEEWAKSFSTLEVISKILGSHLEYVSLEASPFDFLGKQKIWDGRSVKRIEVLLLRSTGVLFARWVL